MKAADIAKELAKIEAEDGRITPEIVVQKAKNPKHGLHNQFEWDDSAAGHKWRLQQARVLIQTAERITVEVNDKVIKVAPYVRDQSVSSREQGYRRVTKVDDDDKYQSMQHELNRAETYLQRAHDIGVAIGYGEEIKGLMEALVNIITRPRPSNGRSKPEGRGRGRRPPRGGDEGRPGL